jgi:protein SCO1
MKRLLTVAALVVALATPAIAQGSGHGHGYAPPPSPQEIDTGFDLRDTHGRVVRTANLRGQWTLVYFGYARCTTSCPIALPVMVEAARRLDARGIPTTAAFVDVDAPMLGVQPRRTGLQAASAHIHDPSEATRALAQTFGQDLLVLTGSRGQINAAVRQFRVLREHTPPRRGEEGHSLNHSTLIYVMDPGGRVAGYLYHDARPEELERFVRRRARG